MTEYNFKGFFFIFMHTYICKSMKRFLLFITFFAVYISAFANMSSPYRNGSRTSEAYSSKDIDILNEKIDITLLKTGQARFKIVYTIQSDRIGRQIPLIFDTMTDHYASGDGDFKVWVNEEEVAVYSIPSTYENPDALRWIDSIDSYLNYSRKEIPDLIGLKYFEVNIPEGINTIKVEYVADATGYLARPVIEFIYNYNLEPARYWRSFGDLYIKVDASEIDAGIETDLKGSSIFAGVEEWHFSELPQDTFTLSYTPKVGWFASLMIAIEGGGLALIITLFLIILHFYWILRYRKGNPGKRFSPAVIVGSIVVPLIFCLLYVVLPELVDWIIGDYASRRHGYLFLIFFMYPVFLIVYFLIAWLVDLARKQRLRREQMKNIKASE